MKDEKGGVTIEKSFCFKPKLYLFLVDDKNEHKTLKFVKKNVIGKIHHSKYKDVLLNNKSLRPSMNRIQSKNHRIVNKVSALMTKYIS